MTGADRTIEAIVEDQPLVVPAERPPRGIRIRRRLGWVLSREATLVCLFALAVGAIINRGAWTDPVHTLPLDLWDPSLVAYLISWDGYALLHHPTSLWHLNTFYPSPLSLGYSDSLLGYAPFGMIGSGPDAAVLRYNIIFTLVASLSVLGTYALTRQLGAGPIAALVAGTAFTMAPWHLSQTGHLHIISTGGIMLALAMLARGHGIRLIRSAASEPPPPVRPGWALAGWLVAAWQITIGFGIGLVFIYVLLGCCVVGTAWWLLRRRPNPGRRLLLADTAGGLIFSAVSVGMALPYLAVLDLYPQARRSLKDIALYSPPLRGFFIAPHDSLIWGSSHAEAIAGLTVPAEMTLLPGFTLYALAAAGLIFSIWSIRARIALAAAVVISIALAMGTEGPDGGTAYVWMFQNLPGFDGLRTPGRLIIWTTLLLAILVAGLLTDLVRRIQPWLETRLRPWLESRRLTGRRPPRRFGVHHGQWVLLLPLLLVLGEGLGGTAHPAVPPAPVAFATLPTPIMVLPSHDMTDMHVMLWSTDGFPTVVNGGSGFRPPELTDTRAHVNSFPDRSSVNYLRRLGVATVVIVTDRARGTVWENAATLPIDGLGLTRDVRRDVVIFHLR